MNGKPERPENPPFTQKALGWCQCGDYGSHSIDSLMLTYLESIPEAGGAEWKGTPTGMVRDTYELLALMADSLGWAEHGGTVHFASLTDEGEAAMQTLRSLSLMDQ